MKTRVLSVSVLLLALSLATFAQTIQERVDVDVVLVDATVTDTRGNQILGLGPDDFIVRENGVEQKVDSVDYFTNRRLLTSPEEKAAFKVERVREERYFILFFDESGGSSAMGRMMRAQKDALAFVRGQLKPEDRVAVASYDARLNIHADFTSDEKILAKALEDVVTFANGLTEVPSYTGEASNLHNIDVDETQTALNDEENLQGLALGGGLSYDTESVLLGFDYAYRHLGVLGSTNFFTLSVGW